MAERRRISSSTGNLMRWIRAHLGQLKSVEVVFIGKGDDDIIRVWAICARGSRRLDKAILKRMKLIAAGRKDLRLELSIEEREGRSKRSMFKSLRKQGAICAYRRA